MVVKFCKFALLDEVTGNPDNIIVSQITAEIPQVALECPLDDIKYGIRSIDPGILKLEDITGSGREEVMEFLVHHQLIEDIRF